MFADASLRAIARQLLKTIREIVTIDRTAKESVRGRLRVMVERVPRKQSCPPNEREKAVKSLLQQVDRLCVDWAD